MTRSDGTILGVKGFPAMPLYARLLAESLVLPHLGRFVAPQQEAIFRGATPKVQRTQLPPPSTGSLARVLATTGHFALGLSLPWPGLVKEFAF